MGYAAVPLALSVFMFIPILWPVFAIVPLALVFVMSIYATQSVTNADSTQVVIANLAGMVVMVLILSIIAFSQRHDAHRRRALRGLFEPIKLARSLPPGRFDLAAGPFGAGRLRSSVRTAMIRAAAGFA